MRYTVLVRALPFLFLFLSGCAAVQPWEKGLLAEEQMRLAQTRPGRGFVEHVLITIEQAEGGQAGAGGGCGCR
jgi:hypothetical protein